jgi:hypothetical protein
MSGDGPCTVCGTTENVVWFTDNVFWNAVCRTEVHGVQPLEPTLCIPCFIALAEERGYRPTGWRLLPEWPRRRALSSMQSESNEERT